MKKRECPCCGEEGVSFEKLFSMRYTRPRCSCCGEKVKYGDKSPLFIASMLLVMVIVLILPIPTAAKVILLIFVYLLAMFLMAWFCPLDKP